MYYHFYSVEHSISYCNLPISFFMSTPTSYYFRYIYYNWVNFFFLFFSVFFFLSFLFCIQFCSLLSNFLLKKNCSNFFFSLTFPYCMQVCLRVHMHNVSCHHYYWNVIALMHILFGKGFKIKKKKSFIFVFIWIFFFFLFLERGSASNCHCILLVNGAYCYLLYNSRRF